MALLFRHPDRTLNDAEVDEMFGRILDVLDRDFGAVLR